MNFLTTAFPRPGGRGSYHRGRRYERDGSWNRGRIYGSYTSYGRWENDYYDHQRYRHIRDAVVLVRRDRQREETDLVNMERSSMEEPKKGLSVCSLDRDTRAYSERTDSKQESTSVSSCEVPNASGQWSLNGIRNEPQVASNNLISFQPVVAEGNVSSMHQDQSSTARLYNQSLNAIDNKITSACISNFKTKGDYDHIRRECMLDIDTKPAFINALGKVKDITNRFLQTAQFHPNMDKAKIRENLKKSFELSRSYQNGLEYLVNQILLPKILNTLRPMVEKEIYRLLGQVDTTSDSSVTSDGNTIQESRPSGNNLSFSTTNADDETKQAAYDKVPSLVCLLPMNVAIDCDSNSKLEASSVPAASQKPASSSKPHFDASELVSNEVDMQLHNDIMEELQELNANVDENEKSSFHISLNGTFKGPSLCDKEMDEYMHVDITEEASGAVLDNFSVKTEQSNELATATVDPTIKSCKQVNANDAISTTGLSAAEATVETENSNQNENGIKYDEGKDQTELASEESGQNCGLGEDEYLGEDDIIDEESGSDEESPEFEKLGEVSQLRVDVIPDYDFTLCNVAIQQIEEKKDNVLKEETMFVNTTIENTPSLASSAEAITSGHNSFETSQQPLCKFLNPDELLTHYAHKILYFKRVNKLSPTEGKTTDVPSRNKMVE